MGASDAICAPSVKQVKGFRVTRRIKGLGQVAFVLMLGIWRDPVEPLTNAWFTQQKVHTELKRMVFFFVSL